MLTLSEIAKQLGSAGGKISAQKRLKNKSKEEISELMKKVRKGAKYDEKSKIGTSNFNSDESSHGSSR